MISTAVLKFAVELTQAPSAALQAAVAAVLPPYAMLTNLGIYVTADSTAAVAPVPPQVRTRITRTVSLRFRSTSAPTIAANTDSNNRVISVGVSYAGTGFGGQPQLYDANFVIPQAGVPVLPKQAPLFRVNMGIQQVIVAQPGSGYTAPTVIGLGGTIGGTQPTTYTATLGAGGDIASIAPVSVPAASEGLYCQAPILQITDSTGSGAQAMVTLNVASVTVLHGGLTGAPIALAFKELFPDLITNENPAAAAAILGNVMGQAIGNAIGFPVIVTPPVIA